MKIGSFCTGYGGLDLAVESYFCAEMVWCSEIDKYASKVIDVRFNKPNLGDIKTIDWANVEPIDIITAGYPCQPFSHAGQRKGTEDERHLWPYIIKAISILRPKYIILENVRGHLSLGFKEVLSDLAQNGYDAKWRIVRASDVGAPHQRARLFIVAYSKGWGSRVQQIGNQKKQSKFRNNNEIVTNSHSGGSQISDKRQQSSKQESTSISKAKFITDSDSNACEKSRRANREISTENTGLQRGQDFGQARSQYRCSCKMAKQAIPNALDQGKLNAKFVEYMMGLPPGWVTDLDLSRSQQLKMLGNGVVPQQAYYALELLLQHADHLG